MKISQNTLSQYFSAVNKLQIISRTNPKGIITEVNNKFLKISGFSRSELIGKSHNIIRHEDTKSEIFKEMWKTILSGKIWSGEIKNKRKNGKPYWTQSIIIPVKDSNNKIIEFISVREDITSEKILLLKSNRETIFRKNILHAQPNIILLIDKVKGIIFANNELFNVITFDSIQSLQSEHSCICELFIEREGFLKKSSSSRLWTQDFFDFPNKIHKAILLNQKSEKRIFNVRLNEFPLKGDLFVVSFSDITELEVCKEDLEKDKITASTAIDFLEKIELSESEEIEKLRLISLFKAQINN